MTVFTMRNCNSNALLPLRNEGYLRMLRTGAVYAGIA